MGGNWKATSDAMELDFHAYESTLQKRKLSIQRRKGRDVGLDRLSVLSDDLLVYILSSLALTDAARTSILSKRWKHVWMLLPSLDFTIRYPPSWSRLEMAYYAASTMIYVLMRVGEHLKDLTLYLPYGSDHVYKMMDTSLVLATKKNIKGRLTVMIGHPCPWYTLPLHLLNSTSITQLHVCRVFLSQSVPFLLKSLKVLHISDIIFREEELERLTSKACCPVLETLKISNCNPHESLLINLTNPTIKLLHIHSHFFHISGQSHICAPYITHLELKGSWRAYVLINFSSLEEFTFVFNEYPFVWEKNIRVDPELHNSLSKTLDNIFRDLPPEVLDVLSTPKMRVYLPYVKHLFLNLEADFIENIPLLHNFFRSLLVAEHLTVKLPPKFYKSLLCPPNCHCGDISTSKGNIVGSSRMKSCRLFRPIFCGNYNFKTIVVEGFYGLDDVKKAENSYTYFHRSWQFELVKTMLRQSMSLKNMIIRGNPRQLKIPMTIVQMCCSLTRASPSAVLTFPCIEGTEGNYISLNSAFVIAEEDKLSKLPNNLLCHILSFLSLRNAVRTSSLSRQWKKIWRWLPVLDFTSVTSCFSSDDAAEIIDYIMTKVEGRMPIFLSALSLCFTDRRPQFRRNLDFWIKSAFVIRDLHYLDLRLPKSYDFNPNSCCRSCFIQQLKLSHCSIILPESPFFFKYLKSMHISHTDLKPLFLERLTSSMLCPVLETLQITCCNNNSELEVYLTNPTIKHFFLDNENSQSVFLFAPFVTHLELRGIWGNTQYGFNDVHSLTEASLDFSDVTSSEDLDLKYLISAFPSSTRVTLSEYSEKSASSCGILGLASKSGLPLW